ncbi:RICIN domain-containing protein [Clostridium saccharobutylicum]|nr:RICIN domain-containing protein [Clostridium saccharobutylicum]
MCLKMKKNILAKISLALGMVTLLSFSSSIPASATTIASGNVYKLINVASGKALDVYAAGADNYTNVDVYSDNGTGAQKWTIIVNPDKSCKLINFNCNKALDVYGAETNDYTNVDIYAVNQTNAQSWNIIYNNDGTYKLINVNSNKALDVYAAGTDDYTNVDIYADNGTDAQKWNIVQVN